MFDKAEVRVRAGGGGDGAVTFRHEKFAPMGGPDGGNGGSGGDVIIIADTGFASLRIFKRNRLYRAGDGAQGKGQKKKGKRGSHLVLKVPVGTMVWEQNGQHGNVLVADLAESGQEKIVAKGGKGGWGNVHFATSTNQTPRIAQKGETGEEKSLLLDLRIIADVGIIGFPNVGKSSLLSRASMAKPKIADYPFTTLEPVLGVVDVGQGSFVMAEIPGLIEGAHAGRGLGSEFLRHALRTRVLVHLVDGTSVSPVDDMVRVNTELRLFDGGLAGKPQVIAVNKIDLPEVQQKVVEIRKAFAPGGMPVFFVSAATGEGVAALMSAAYHTLQQLAAAEAAGPAAAAPMVFHPEPSGGSGVHREEAVFVIDSPEIERIVARVDVTDPEVMRQVRGLLERSGISRALAREGIEAGDSVRCGESQWDW
jgi:GTP-binding protein